MYCARFGVRGDYAAFGFDIDRFAVLRHALRALLQYPRFFNRKVDLFRFDILNLAAHRAVSTYRLRRMSAAAVTQIGRPVSLKWLSRRLISMPRRRSSCLMLSSNGPHRLNRRALSAGSVVISRVSMFKPFLLSVCRRKLNIHRPIRKLFTPQEKGASIAIKMGIKRETRPTGTAGLRITADNNPRQGRFLCGYGQSPIPVFLPRADPFHLQFAPLYRAESSGRRR